MGINTPLKNTTPYFFPTPFPSPPPLTSSKYPKPLPPFIDNYPLNIAFFRTLPHPSTSNEFSVNPQNIKVFHP